MLKILPVVLETCLKSTNVWKANVNYNMFIMVNIGSYEKDVMYFLIMYLHLRICGK